MTVVLVAIAVPLRGLLRYQGPPMEEGFMLVFAERVLAGDVANEDFLHLYGPGSLWVLAGVFKVFGPSLPAERLVGLAQQLGIVFGLFALALPWGRRVAAACALIALVIIVPPIGLAALAWNGAVALGLAGMAVGLRGHVVSRTCRGCRCDTTTTTTGSIGVAPTAGRWHFLVAGVLGGLALLYRPDLILAVGLAGTVLAWSQGRERGGRIAAGLGIGVAPYLVHGAMAGVGNSIEGMLLDPVFELRGGRSLPVPPSWGELDGFLQRAGVLRAPEWPLPAPTTSNQIFLWFVLVLVAAPLIVAAGVLARRRDPASHRGRVLLVVGAFAVGLLPQALQRPDTTHFAWVSCVSLGFLPVALLELGAGPLRRLRPSGRGMITGGIVALLLVVAIPHFTFRAYADLSQQSLGRNVFGVPMQRNGRTFYYGSQDAAVAGQALIDDLDRLLQPGQRLLVGPLDLRKTPYSDAFYSFLFPELTPATRYIEMDPGVANRADSGLDGDVASADWLILSDTWSDWDEPNDSRRFGSDLPNRVVARSFCLVSSYDTFFFLYRRCRASGGG
ncbi:MAG: hypothetical protein WKF43_14485 [Acidimicrobiales bacterium]